MEGRQKALDVETQADISDRIRYYLRDDSNELKIAVIKTRYSYLLNGEIPRKMTQSANNGPSVARSRTIGK